jgi:hypothetical protein
MAPHVYREPLSNDQQWQGIAINFVHAPIDQQVPSNPEKDQQVKAWKKRLLSNT